MYIPKTENMLILTPIIVDKYPIVINTTVLKICKDIANMTFKHDSHYPNIIIDKKSQLEILALIKFVIS